MRKGILSLVAVTACCVWMVAWAGAAQQSSAGLQITKGPVLEMVGDTSAVIAWSTNVPGSTVLKYGTDPNNLSQTAEAPWGNTTHRVTLKSLQPNTTYYFQVESAQGQGTGTGALSKQDSFQTVASGAPPKHYAPVK